ncbi:PHP domain-containing protein, partial [uncultured Parolsenella sp.]|uniref:PHP domain-containing protein n=1 Tax=uncultured Parolsenella sp. TaxID=2083008 RepID=UPI0027D9541A
MAFVHLHNHTDYSMLDGATRVADMVKRAVDEKMPAVAITDHGYMYGVPDLDLACAGYNHKQADWQQWFHDKDNYAKGREIHVPDKDEEPEAYAQWERDVAAYEAGDTELATCKPTPLIKPIFGCEAYFTPDDTLARGKKPALYHMILLAKNETGYVNLMQMMSDAAVRGFYYKPRTTLQMLKEHHEGVICTSACVSGIVPRHILNGQPDEALKWARTFAEVFGKDDFYIEIQDHGLTFESGMTDRQLDEQLVELARSLDLKVICTNDFHYLTRDDAPVQDLMMCIGMNAKVDDDNRMRMEGSE